MNEPIRGVGRLCVPLHGLPRLVEQRHAAGRLVADQHADAERGGVLGLVRRLEEVADLQAKNQKQKTHTQKHTRVCVLLVGGENVALRLILDKGNRSVMM